MGHLEDGSGCFEDVDHEDDPADHLHHDHGHRDGVVCFEDVVHEDDLADHLHHDHGHHDDILMVVVHIVHTESTAWT